jgi:hypothetical protein
LPGSLARSAVAFTTLLALGCTIPDQPIAPSGEQVVVHAILDPGSRVQLVLVERARTGDRNAVACGQSGSGIGGADVSITTPSGVVMRGVEDTTHLLFGCLERLYRVPLDAYGMSLTPGGTYGLRVRTPSGQEVTGSTTIPDASLTVPEPPAEPFSFLRDTLRLQWIGARGAAGYEVRVDSHAGLELSTAYFVSDSR